MVDVVFQAHRRDGEAPAVWIVLQMEQGTGQRIDGGGFQAVADAAPAVYFVNLKDGDTVTVTITY